MCQRCDKNSGPRDIVDMIGVLNPEGLKAGKGASSKIVAEMKRLAKDIPIATVNSDDVRSGASTTFLQKYDKSISEVEVAIVNNTNDGRELLSEPPIDAMAAVVENIDERKRLVAKLFDGSSKVGISGSMADETLHSDILAGFAAGMDSVVGCNIVDMELAAADRIVDQMGDNSYLDTLAQQHSTSRQLERLMSAESHEKALADKIIEVADPVIVKLPLKHPPQP